MVGIVNNSGAQILRGKKAFLFDLDGCVYYGETAAPGAVELLRKLRQDGRRVGFVTNNSRDTGIQIAERLERMGITVRPEEIVTATECVGRYIHDRYGKLVLKTAGSRQLDESLAAAGHRVLDWDDSSLPDAVVIGRDTGFTYDKLERLANDILSGAKAISCNPDIHHPGLTGRFIPETGSIAAAIEAMIGRQMEFVGKPGPELFRRGLELCGCTPEEAVMTGDNVKTDIAGGRNANLTTVWIDLAGQGISQLREEETPDIMVDGLENMLRLYLNRRNPT